MAIGDLRMSWRKSTTLPPSEKLVEDVYRICIGKLAPTPGEIYLERSKSTQQRVVEYRMSCVYEQHSGKHHEKKDIDRDYPIKPTPGWKILRGSAAFVIDGRETSGKPEYKVTRQDEEMVVCNVKTKHRSRHSGRIRFRVSYQEHRVLEETDVTCTAVELMWKGSLVFDCPSQWKVCFKPFNESGVREFVQSTIDDSFITLSASGGKLLITARDPAVIVLPAAIPPIPLDSSPESFDSPGPDKGGFPWRNVGYTLVGFGAGVFTGRWSKL